MNTIMISKAKNFPVIPEKKSPFAIYQNEQLVKMEDFNCQTISLVKNDLDLLIIVTINRLLVTTSAILSEMLISLGADVSQKELQKHLKILAASEFLDAYRFESNSGKERAANKVYMLGWRGAGLLKNKKIKPRLCGYLKEASSDQIKKILSASQYIVKAAVDPNDFKMCETIFSVSKNATTQSKIFRPQAMIKMKNDTIFIEAVRRTADWRKNLIGKMERIAKVSQCKNTNIEFIKSNSTLLLIGEDSAHTKQIMQLVEATYLCFPVKVAYTSDTLTYSKKDCVYSIKPNFFEALFSA